MFVLGYSDNAVMCVCNGWYVFIPGDGCFQVCYHPELWFFFFLFCLELHAMQGLGS